MSSTIGINQTRRECCLGSCPHSRLFSHGAYEEDFTAVKLLPPPPCCSVSFPSPMKFSDCHHPNNIETLPFWYTCSSIFIVPESPCFDHLEAQVLASTPKCFHVYLAPPSDDYNDCPSLSIIVSRAELRAQGCVPHQTHLHISDWAHSTPGGLEGSVSRVRCPGSV